MSIDGNKENIRVHHGEQTDQLIALQQERIDELRKYLEQCITYQREITEEKDKQIRYLTEQLKNCSGGNAYYSGSMFEETPVQSRSLHTTTRIQPRKNNFQKK